MNCLKIKVFILCLGFTVGLVYPGTNPSNTFRPARSFQFPDKIDKKKTAANLFSLTMLTVMPVLPAMVISQKPEYKTELMITVSFSAVPALFGWPLFFHEIRKYRRDVRRARR